MKNCAVSLFILVFLTTAGCEISDINNSTGESQTLSIAQKLVSEDNKQVVKQQAVKSIVTKQEVELSSKPDSNPPQSKVEEYPALGGQTQEQRTLDLSVPLKLPKTKNSGNASSIEKQSYLPELFTDQKNKSMHIDGKIIRREEEQVGKDRVEDGVGIDIKLAH